MLVWLQVWFYTCKISCNFYQLKKNEMKNLFSLSMGRGVWSFFPCALFFNDSDKMRFNAFYLLLCLCYFAVR